MDRTAKPRVSPLRHLVLIKRGLVRALEGVVILLMATLVLDVLWQVLSRYAFRRPSSWTDELATLLVIWLALLGASVALGRQAHLGVDVLVRQLSPAPRRLIEIVVHSVVGFFAVAVLILGGTHLVRLAWLTGQVSPALGVNMGHVYLALPISGVFMLIFALESLLQCLSGRPISGEPPAADPTEEDRA
jgi:TRAP-type C4-dicarboxylate transport system permease small subunit